MPNPLRPSLALVLAALLSAPFSLPVIGQGTNGAASVAGAEPASHAVVAGETLAGIAERHGVSELELRVVNPELPPEGAPPGFRLRIPPQGGRLVALPAGSTLLALALEHGVSPAELARANGLRDLGAAGEGQLVFVPPAASGTPGTGAPAAGSAGAGSERHDPVGALPSAVTGDATLAAHAAAAPTLPATPLVPISPQERRNRLREGALAHLPRAGAELRRWEPPAQSLVWPLASFSRISSRFGYRNISVGGNTFHGGVDIAAPPGTPILAANAGVVERAGWIGAYGYAVYLDHADGTQTRYAHMSAVHVRPGQAVRQGEPIGAVGSTGASTGPHLHFEVRLQGRAVDPLLYVRP